MSTNQKQFKHTPGPWIPYILDKPLSNIPAYVQTCIDSSGGNDFYFVGAVDPERGDVDIAHVGNGPRAKTHARLIAAAPDLYEALTSMLTYMGMDEDQWNKPIFDQCRDALAKARGQDASRYERFSL